VYRSHFGVHTCGQCKAKAGVTDNGARIVVEGEKTTSVVAQLGAA
jgi:hypothetical protein